MGMNRLCLDRLQVAAILLALWGGSWGGSVIAQTPIAQTQLAQYDRDGRYVPSPNGIPTDPYPRPIPLYPGTPGRAIGTPSLPRYAIPPPQFVAPPAVPPIRAYPFESLPKPRLVPLAAGSCRNGWSRSTGLTPTAFRRQCAHLPRR